MLKVLATLAVAGALAFTPANRTTQSEAATGTAPAQLRQMEISSGPDAAGRARTPALDEEQAAAIDPRKLDAIEPLVQAAIADKKLPGAVVLIGRGDRILYQ